MFEYFRQYLIVCIAICSLLTVTAAYAQGMEADVATTGKEKILTTLITLANHQMALRDEIKDQEKKIKASHSDAERGELQSQLKQLEEELLLAQKNFKAISTGVEADDSSQKTQAFDIQDEALSLLEPIVKEMKNMTSDVRKKAALRESVSIYKERLPAIRAAIKSVNDLLENSTDKQLKEQLKKILEERERQLTSIQSKLQTAEFQLDKIVSAETSFTESSQGYLKKFFQRRGLYLAIAVLVVGMVLLISRLTRKVIVKYLPGYQRKRRSFQIRMLDLAHQAITAILCIAGPMAVFYIAEDWVLFSLGVLLLLAIGWTLRTAVPRYWNQIKLFLNIGSVREGERIYYGGLPWEVKQINVFTVLENPVAGISQRVAIEELVDMNSRPVKQDEPWFPCKKDDWVILNDGIRGKVTGISHEFVELVERGGSHKTYMMQEFLRSSPRNLSLNFRIKETVTIDYRHQAESTASIPVTLESYLRKRIEEEGYAQDLLSLRVEFQEANSSSLDIVVIADFNGEMGSLYNRLRRAIQRWAVDACTENEWGIPFPQLSVSMSSDIQSSA